MKEFFTMLRGNHLKVSAKKRLAPLKDHFGCDVDHSIKKGVGGC